MIDLAIIGAGFWGVATALVAEARGATVTLISSNMPTAASRAASGYFAHSWYKDLWKDRAAEAHDLALKHGIDLVRTGADVMTYKNARLGGGLGRMLPKSDWSTFTPAAFLARRTADEVGYVVNVRPGEVRLAAGQVVLARAIVIAAGAATDHILFRSKLPMLGVTGLGGRGIIIEGSPPPRTILHHVSPYHALAVRPWGENRLRFGETIEQKPAKSAEYVEKLWKALNPYKPVNGRVIEEQWGLRPVCNLGPTVMSIPCPTPHKIVVASGGGRVGGVLSFWAAQEACDLVGIDP